MIRALRLSDIEELRKIHARYYSNEFEFPDFLHNYLCAFAVVSDDKIVSVGGVRNIAESVVMTNKDFSTRARRQALFEIFDASAFVAGKFGHQQLHAFIQDDIWKEHLKKVGFGPTVGQSLVLNL